MIETGKMYGCFDDGKITCGRFYQAYIAQERKMEDLPDKLKGLLARVAEDRPRLFEPNPQTVLEGISYEESLPHVVYFLPTGKDQWFGAGKISYDYETLEYQIDKMWCSGRLDVDGSLTKKAFE